MTAAEILEFFAVEHPGRVKAQHAEKLAEAWNYYQLTYAPEGVKVGLPPAWVAENEAPPDPLAGRMSKCNQHREHPTMGVQGGVEPSKLTLMGFRHHPEREYDEHYCGCYGWD